MRRWTATQREHEFDFAMLLPPFSGVGLKAFDRDSADITDRHVPPQRVHARGRRLHAQAIRAMESG